MAQDVSLELACSGLPSVLINGDVAPTDAQVLFIFELFLSIQIRFEFILFASVCVDRL